MGILDHLWGFQFRAVRTFVGPAFLPGALSTTLRTLYGKDRPWIFLALQLFFALKDGPARKGCSVEWGLRKKSNQWLSNILLWLTTCNIYFAWWPSTHTHTHLKQSFSKQYLHLYMWHTLVFYFLFYSISLNWFHGPLMDCNLYFEKHWSNRWWLVLEGDWGRCCSWIMKFRWAMPKAEQTGCIL